MIPTARATAAIAPSAARTRRCELRVSLRTGGPAAGGARSACPAGRARPAAAKPRTQALAGLGGSLECRAVALGRVEAAAESKSGARHAAATVVVERGVRDVNAVRAHALGELDDLLLQLGALLGTQVGPRERLREV